MRKIVAGLHVALDGVVEAPEAWSFPYYNDELGQEVGAQMAASDTMLLGRVTYQGFADYWPNLPSSNPFAERMNNTPKYVVSTTLKSTTWQNTTLIAGDVAEEIAKLKQQPGKNIAITGSATLVRSLLRDKLLDELRLFVHPIVIGSGKRLFPEGSERTALMLIESRSFSTGAVSLVYTPAGR